MMIPLYAVSYIKKQPVFTWNQLIWRWYFIYFPPVLKANTFVCFSFSLVVAPSCDHWPMQPGRIARPRDSTNGRDLAPCSSASASGALSLCCCVSPCPWRSSGSQNSALIESFGKSTVIACKYAWLWAVIINFPLLYVFSCSVMSNSLQPHGL